MACLTGAVVSGLVSWASQWLCLTNTSNRRRPLGVAVASSEWDSGRPGGWWGWEGRRWWRGGLIAFIDGIQRRGRTYRWQMIGTESEVKIDQSRVHFQSTSYCISSPYFYSNTVVAGSGKQYYIRGTGSICCWCCESKYIEDWIKLIHQRETYRTNADHINFSLIDPAKSVPFYSIYTRQKQKKKKKKIGAASWKVT